MTHIGSDRPIALIGPHSPFRGGIAHFTERVATEIRTAKRTVLPVSFSRLYPGWLFPGKSQYESPKELVDPAFEWIDSLNPRSWGHTAQKMIDREVSVAVFMYWMPFFAPAFAHIANRLSKEGIPVIGVVHNALPHERHVADALLSSRFLKKCDSIVVLSDSVRADVSALVPSARIRLQPHPVYDRFGERVEPSAARKRLGVDESARVLLFFGMVRKYKGLDILIDALPMVVNEIEDVVLIVAGEFYDDVESYRSRLERTGLADKVQLIDEYVPTRDVGLYFSAADVVVQPYRAATQSGVVRTAHHFGLPVIATNVGGLAADIQDGGVLVPPEDPVALARAIAKYFADNQKPGLQENVRRLQRESGWASFVEALFQEANIGA